MHMERKVKRMNEMKMRKVNLFSNNFVFHMLLLYTHQIKLWRQRKRMCNLGGCYIFVVSQKLVIN